MILNFALLAMVFGASKKKLNPYAAAVLFGLVKGGLVFWLGRNVIAALIVLVLYAGAAAAMAYFLDRVDRKELSDDPYPKYGRKKNGTFKWEYVPLTTAVAFLVFGDMILTMAFR
jgi:hypothetical protein